MFDDYCALADLPTSTVADVEALQRQSRAAQEAHRGKVVGDATSNARIVTAALKLDLAIAPALLELRASGSQSDLVSAFRSAAPDLMPSLTQAQADLRSACAR